VITLADRNGWPTFEVRPSGSSPGTTIVYLHGGGYVSEITGWHWRLIRQLVREVPARVVAPIYPLAPRATADRVVPEASRLLGEVVEESGPVVLAGDSAGGGMAVAASCLLRDRGAAQPSRLVLISPFLDVTMTDERQLALAPKDKMLRRPGLREAGRLYAGSLDLDDPLVSPIYGDLRGLPPVSVFTGTHDLLDPDSRRLAELAREAGVPLELHEVRGAPHAFPVLPTRQGAAARAQLVEICRRAI
jgi:acetyl esterase/lipase